MTRILLIYNPVSGRAKRSARDAAVYALSRAGWSVDVARTRYAGHAADLARAAVVDGVDAVAVFGGDGTVAQAIGGLLGADVPLGILPGGTGNQLARNLGIRGGPDRAARLIASGRTRRIDVGLWKAGEAESCFAVACGAGFDAQVMAATSVERKRRGRMVAYVAEAVRSAMRLRAAAFRVTVDGSVTETEAATVLVVNCPRVVPPYRPLRRGVALDDGVLDVVCLRATGLLESLAVWGRLAAGRDDPARIRHLRGREIRVESEPEVLAECDGDVTGSTPFEARVSPAAVAVFVPTAG